MSKTMINPSYKFENTTYTELTVSWSSREINNFNYNRNRVVRIEKGGILVDVIVIVPV